jgi:hypothetical protein
MSNNLIIFGCGGVGSWLADFLVRNKSFETISLVDFDNVEEKNLVRQNFTHSSIGGSKVGMLKDHLNWINDSSIIKYNRKINDELDLTFDKESIAVICTDNVVSKRLIAKYFSRFLLVNCDKDFVEIKNFLDDDELNAWDMGGGYTSEQNIVSNLYAATALFHILQNRHFDGSKKRLTVKIESDINSKFRLAGRGE